GDGYASRVGINIGNDQDALFPQDLFRLGSRRAVGGFEQNPGLDPGGIRHSDLVFESRRDQDIAFELESISGARDIGSSRIAEYGARLLAMREDLGLVKTAGIEDGSLLFGDRHDQGSAFTAVLSRVVTDVSESLDYQAFSFDPF